MSLVDPSSLPRRPRLSDAQRLSVAEFKRVIADFPEHERWELVDGHPVMMNPTSHPHFLIMRNLMRAIEREWDGLQPDWMPFPNKGVFIEGDEGRAAMPDLVIDQPPFAYEGWTPRPLAVFEVISPSSQGQDRGWKVDFYGRVQTCLAYVVIDQRRRRVEIADRTNGFRLTPVRTPCLGIAGLDLRLEIAGLYAGLDPWLDP